MVDHLVPAGKAERRRTLVLSMALRHPPTARWPLTNPRGRERIATPPGGLPVRSSAQASRRQEHGEVGGDPL